MKFSTVIATLATVVLGVQALPQPLARSNNSKTAVGSEETSSFLLVALDFKATFYDTLSNYTEKDFTNAGYSSLFWKEYKEIADNADKWKNNITEVIGSNAVSPHSYSFKHSDPDSFVRESAVIEAITLTAYSSIYDQSKNEDYYNTVGEILEAELELVSWLLSYFDGTSWDGYFKDTLSIEQAYTLIAPYACSSSSSASSPYGSYASLSYTVIDENANSSAQVGSWLSLTYDYTPANSDEEIFAVFITAETEYYVTVKDGKVQIPKEIDVAVALLVISTSNSSINQEDVVTAFVLIILEEVSTTGSYKA